MGSGSQSPRRGYAEIQGLDPRSGEKAIYRLSISEFERFRKYAPTVKTEVDLRCVPEVLKRPVTAFEGIREVHYTELGHPEHFDSLPESSGLCICGSPRVVQRPGVFCVFASADLIIIGWDWYDADAEEPDKPRFWETRFRRQVWPKN